MAFRARRGGGEVLTTRETLDIFEATATFFAPRDAVWSVLWDPRTAQAIRPEILHSVALPGTGPGVGEIHVHVETSAKGATMLGGIVVEACRPPEFVRYRGLDDVLHRSITEITYTAAAADRTTVHWVTTVRWERGVPNAAIENDAQAQRDFIATYLRGSGRVLGAPMELDGCWRRT